MLALSLNSLEFVDDLAVFRIQTLLKSNRQGDPRSTLKFKSYDYCRRLCVLSHIKEYVLRTAPLRKEEDQFFISTIRPHAGVCRDTISNWTTDTLELAGIDVVKYGGHSTRGTAASTAKNIGVGMNLLMKQAGWKNAESFARHYHKDILQDATEVGEALLNNAMNLN